MTFVNRMNPSNRRTSVLKLVFLCALSVILQPTLASRVAANAQEVGAQQAPPKTWVDTATGHRVTRLTDEPNSRSLYFDVNAYTPDGLDMIYTSPKGIHDLNLATLKSELIVSGKVADIVVGTKTRRIFYENYADGHYYVVDIDTKQVTKLPSLPLRGHVSTINADETLLAGTYVEGTALEFVDYKTKALSDAHDELVAQHQALVEEHQRLAAGVATTPEKPAVKTGGEVVAKANAEAMEARYEAHSPEDMFTLNLKTGEVKVILKGTDWLNHVQFSPTDPSLILYAHEGPSLKVDRIWTIRADGSKNRLIHQRNDPSGIATHEFWSHDGKIIWFDLQESKGEDFSVAGVEVETGKRVVHHLKKAEASLHYNVAWDGSVFCGDGNVPAHGEIGVHGHRTLNRKWIELLRPHPDGTFHSTRLVSLDAHDYLKAEPSVRFTPDNRSVIFTSNMFGKDYVFAVEIAKPAATAPSTTAAGG